MKITEKEEKWKEGYDEGWDNGFRACLHYLRETLSDEIIKNKRIKEAEDDNTRFRRL